jgi:hypothetical protein
MADMRGAARHVRYGPEPDSGSDECHGRYVPLSSISATDRIDEECGQLKHNLCERGRDRGTKAGFSRLELPIAGRFLLISLQGFAHRSAK